MNCQVTTGLPFLTAASIGVGGRLKVSPEDFQVEEIPVYQPCGSGQHLFLWVEKTDTSADRLTGHLAKSLGISRNDIGMAGLKDRRAVTRQFLSVPAESADRVPSLETDQIRILSQSLHSNKLKTGHLKGNRFSILVRDVDADATLKSSEICTQINQLGFPNYFGDQRFGIEQQTLQTGLKLLDGSVKQRDLPYSRRKFLLRLSLSAVQSHLFNQVVGKRIRDGLLHRVVAGDVMQVVETGGCFVVDDVEAEQRRFDQRETVLTGPLFGPKMKQPTSDAAEYENRVLDRNGLSADAFHRFRKLTSGTRRPMLAFPTDLEITAETEGLRFSFSLSRGTYATMLLREFMKVEEQDPSHQS